MDFGLAADYQSQQMIFSPQVRLEKSSAPDLIEILQSLHASLEPRQVVASYGKAVEQYLPITGMHIQLPEHHFHFGSNQGKVFKRHFQIQRQAAEVSYRLTSTLAPKQLSLLLQLEELLKQPLENALQHHEISNQALLDSLTNLGNRRYYEKVLASRIACFDRSGEPLSLVILDLDKLKFINDSFGHQFGDVILEEFAKLLQSTVRDTDHTFRVGGDEFIILVHGNEEAAKILLNRLEQNLTTQPLLKQFDVGFSAGMSELTRYISASDLYAKADKSMYEVKMKKKKEGR
ncbi:GGDEF domain-containing protein [Parashewanella curva]|uniref:diguanylate cyclase n=1 Tax=Parashewanella curva TaxID=2338552 RepID=A0A3L8PTK2_9GAMM|nr:GGDEF domain-containing protein [Parashewanella curva]RLV58730.1 GGDEF domain-containing protein [Parashewanella curva]